MLVQSHRTNNATRRQNTQRCPRRHNFLMQIWLFIASLLGATAGQGRQQQCAGLHIVHRRQRSVFSCTANLHHPAAEAAAGFTYTPSPAPTQAAPAIIDMHGECLLRG